jgi:hypothetical protein
VPWAIVTVERPPAGGRAEQPAAPMATARATAVPTAMAEAGAPAGAETPAGRRRAERTGQQPPYFRLALVYHSQTHPGPIPVVRSLT